jgi:hypothetical protein
METIMNDLQYTLKTLQTKKETEIKNKEKELLVDDNGVSYMSFAKDYSVDKLMMQMDFINSNKLPKLTKIQQQKDITLDQLDILSWNETEIAIQLTLIDYNMFLQIHPKGKQKK